MKTKAAVLVELNRPLEIWDLEIPSLKPGQVLVELQYSGVCHTQVLEVRGRRGPDRFLPHCVGHEGSGIVRECGTGVSRVKPGEAVVLSWIKAGGLDVPGTLYSAQGGTVNAGGITTFQQLSVVSENRLTVLPRDFPMREAALVGCAVPTGVGAVVNTMQARLGQSVAVFGAGGIGLCAVAAAHVSGCWPIFAIDVQPGKLILAQSLGASHVINAQTHDPVTEIKAVVPQGLDGVIECTGRPTVMQQTLACLRSQGGVAVIVGNAPAGETCTIDPRELNQGKRLIGTWGGDNVPDRDFPRYLRMMASGRLNFAPLLADEYRLDQVNQALDDLEAGKLFRPLIRF